MRSLSLRLTALGAALALSWPAVGQEAAAPQPPPIPGPPTFAGELPPKDSAAWEPGQLTVPMARRDLIETRAILEAGRRQREDLRAVLADMRELSASAHQQLSDLKAELAQAQPRPSATVVEPPPAPAPPPANPPASATPQSQAVQVPGKAVPTAQAVEVPAATTATYTGPGRVRHPGPLRRVGGLGGDLLVGLGQPLQHLRDVKVVSYIPYTPPARVSSQTVVQTQHTVMTTPATPPPTQAVQAVPTATPQSTTTVTTTPVGAPRFGLGLFRR